MATFNGTTGSDSIIGTADNDILAPIGSDVPDPEYLAGLDGADEYSMYRAAGTGYYSYIIDDQGTDGATDSIIGSQAMYQVTAEGGVETFAQVERVGDDMIIHLPSKDWGYRDPYIAPTEIVIVDHYAGTGVEQLSTGYDVYTLSTGLTGTAGADIIAGDDAGSTIDAGAGGDWAYGNGGSDNLRMGGGDDYGFGGAGTDTLRGQADNDRLFGEDGDDLLLGAKGNDSLDGGAGDDSIYGGRGDDVVDGGSGTNTIRTAGGADVIVFTPAPDGQATYDIVEDFALGSDLIDLTAAGLTQADLTIGETATGAALVIWDNGTGPGLTVELLGLSASDVTADMFLFA